MTSSFDNPLVSIALCTYNGERFLKEQLDSIVQQSYNNFEIVIVDDCSKDQTVDIIKSYQKRYPFIKLYQNEANLGYIKNFEKAISLCAGDYIGLSDQDDIWSLNKISVQLDQIGQHMLSYHDSEFVDASGNSLGKAMSNIARMYSGNSYKPFLFFNCVSGHACFFKKELIQYCLPFPKEIFHDRWLAFTATNVGSIGYVNETLVKYRQHENADTNILRLKRVEKRIAETGIRRINKTLLELKVFSEYAYLKNASFIKKLIRLYTTRLNSYVCFRLVFFMYSNFKNLLFISNKSLGSKLNFVFKHIWGSKIKRFE